MTTPSPEPEQARVIEPYGVRLAWSDLPVAVTTGVADLLGSAVVSAATQRGGFSPGSADRVITADGHRAFVKAVCSDLNPATPDLLRREASVLSGGGLLPLAPELIGLIDDGDWVALVVQDIPGRHPHTPWVEPEIRATFQTLRRLGEVAAPTSWAALEEELTAEFTAWDRIADSPPHGLAPGWAHRLTELDRLSRATLTRLRGDRVCHTDIRSDNLLVQADGPARAGAVRVGAVRVVDWPWASRGPRWFDAATLLINIELCGSRATDWVPEVLGFGATTKDLVGTVAGIGGFLVEAAGKPAPPGLPTLRAFQSAQADACLRLLESLGC